MTDKTTPPSEPNQPLGLGCNEQLGAGSEALYLASDMRSPESCPRFTVQDGGSWIDDDDFIFDAMIKISGDFSDQARARFSQWVCDTLNEADKKLPREPRAG